MSTAAAAAVAATPMIVAAMTGSVGTALSLGTSTATSLTGTVCVAAASRSIEVVRYLATQAAHPSFADFAAVVRELDVEAKVEVWHALLRDVDDRLLGRQGSDAPRIAARLARSAFADVEAVLEAAHTAQKLHGELYFSAWRSADCTGFVHSLRSNVARLENRLQLLRLSLDLLQPLATAWVPASFAAPGACPSPSPAAAPTPGSATQPAATPAGRPDPGAPGPSERLPQVAGC